MDLELIALSLGTTLFSGTDSLVREESDFVWDIRMGLLRELIVFTRHEPVLRNDVVEAILDLGYVKQICKYVVYRGCHTKNLQSRIVLYFRKSSFIIQFRITSSLLSLASSAHAAKACGCQ